MKPKGQQPVKRVRRDVHGILLLDKPRGISSNAALQKAKYLLRAKKAGHTGSLDPLATGMLPLCFGDATRFSHAMLDANKCYEVTATLGQQSTTGDAEGEKSLSVEVPSLDKAAWQALADGFLGAIEQVPPMYSALKHDGKRLYQLARAGETVVRQPRTITIFSFDVLSVDGSNLALKVMCSKGTYIRTLVEDLAVAAGTLAWTARLHRVSVAPFTGAMVTLDAIETADDEHARDALLLPVDSAIQAWPVLNLDDEQTRRFCVGQSFNVDSEASLHVRCYGRDNVFLGSGAVSSDGMLRPARVMASAQAMVQG